MFIAEVISKFFVLIKIIEPLFDSKDHSIYESNYNCLMKVLFK